MPRDSSRKFYWTLGTASALSVLSRDAEWTWYRDGDAVRFVRRDDPVLRTDGVVPTEFAVEAGGRRGWISGTALMPEGVTCVSGSSEADRRMIAIYQALWDRVWQPCADFAYNLVAATRGEGAVGLTAKMRVVELMLPWLDDVAAELEDVGVDTLSESEASALYRDLRMQCRSGAVRDRGQVPADVVSNEERVQTAPWRGSVGPPAITTISCLSRSRRGRYAERAFRRGPLNQETEPLVDLA